MKHSAPIIPHRFDAGSQYQKAESERISEERNLGWTLYGWEGDRLAWESRDEESIHYLYEPGSFIPIAQGIQEHPVLLHKEPNWAGREYKFKDDPLWQQHPEAKPFARLSFYHCDQIGTPQIMTDEKGEIVWQANYKAWGEARIATEKVKNPLRFQGQYFDHETGLHYNRYRYYDPEIGRFISKDPIGLMGGLNLHAYAPNPVGWVDPLGLVAEVTVEGNNVHIIVPILYRNSTGLPDNKFKSITKKFNEGISKKWTGTFGKYNVTTEVVERNRGNLIDVREGSCRAEVREGSNRGVLCVTASGDVAAHEAGHLMKLEDRYDDKKDRYGNTIDCIPRNGYEDNIMACPDYSKRKPSEDDIKEIIEKNRKP
jgi:RHS repeat-associated protein